MKKILIVTLTLMLAVVFVACTPAEPSTSPADDIAEDTMEETDGDPVAEIPEDDMTENDATEEDATEDDATEDGMTEEGTTEEGAAEEGATEVFEFAGTTWQAIQMVDAEGNSLDATAIEAALGGIPVMTLNDDGTAVATVGETEASGTWTFDGTTFILSTDSGDGQGTFDGSTLTIVEAQGTTVYGLVTE